MAFRYADIDSDLRDRIEKGVVAIRRINSHENFENWLAVGQACADMQTAAMRLAYANQPKGRAYNDAFKMIAEQVPDLANLDKTTRSHAIWIADQSRRDAIVEWHARLPANIRLQVNHPTTVWRRYNRETAAPTVPGESPAPSGLKAEVARLQEELDTANKRLSRGDGQDFTMADSDDDIVRVLVESPYRAKWLRIARGIVKADNDARKLAGGTVGGGKPATASRKRAAAAA